MFSDGTSGWLSDASLEYAVSFLRPLPPKVPPAHELPRGWTQFVDNVKFEVTSITRAHYEGVEGELPFQYWGKTGRNFRRYALRRRAIRNHRLQRGSPAAVCG